MIYLLSDQDLNDWNNYINNPQNQYLIVKKEINYSNILDLHNLTINNAYKEVINFIEESYFNKIKNIKIITGKSGQINKEFYYWLEYNKYIKNINNKNGYYLITLKNQ